MRGSQNWTLDGGVELDERTTCAAILAEKRRCLARNIGASLPPAQCEACGRGEVQAHMRDDESRAQLHWACKQTTHATRITTESGSSGQCSEVTTAPRSRLALREVFARADIVDAVA